MNTSLKFAKLFCPTWFNGLQRRHGSSMYVLKCSEVANIFKAKCLELGLVYSVVKSSSRVRCDYGNTAGFNIKQLKNFAKNQKKGEKYLSKVPNQKARELFPNLKIVNSETVDAALLIPELL